MSVALEALAMAGMDSGEWGVDVEEWEKQDLNRCPPPYLLAQGRDDNNEADEEPNRVHNYGNFFCTNQVVLSHHQKVDGSRPQRR